MTDTEILSNATGTPIDNEWDRNKVAAFVADCVLFVVALVVVAVGFPAFVTWWTA